MAKKFFYVCAGLLMLALAYQLGVRNAQAQAPGNSVVGMSDPWIVTANGDLYILIDGTTGQCIYKSNVFGGPVPTRQSSWGSIKVQSR